MFNKTIINQKKTEYVPYVKEVHEHKAPTDESIRLLNEFKEKALKDTMLVFEVKNTAFDYIARYGEDVATHTKHVSIKFSFNGEEIVENFDIPMEMGASRQGVVDFCMNKLEDLISSAVRKAMFKPDIIDLFNRLY